MWQWSYQACSDVIAVTDGGWSDWSEFGSCSVTCGNGLKYRTRSCTNPAPANGGRACLGSSEDTTSCDQPKCGPTPMCTGDFSESGRPPAGTKCLGNTCQYQSGRWGNSWCYTEGNWGGPCVACATWSEWSDYGACSRTCGTARKARTRSCSKGRPENGYRWSPCPGVSRQVIDCQLPQCGVNGAWSAWSSYSSCSATCGTATKARTRTCSNPAPANGGEPCLGLNQQTRDCQLVQCGEGLTANKIRLLNENLDSAIEAMETAVEAKMRFPNDNIESIEKKVEALQIGVESIFKILSVNQPVGINSNSTHL